MHQMINSFYNAVPCTFDSTILSGLDLTGGAAANLDIATAVGATIGPLYVNVGLFLDQVMGQPFSVTHGPAHTYRAGAKVRQQLAAAGVTYDAGAMFNANSTLTLALTQPTEVAPLAHLFGTLSPGAGANVFERDGISGLGAFSAMDVYPGAYVKISGTVNPGWYQIVEIDGTGRKAVLMKTAAKKIPIDTFVPAPWVGGPYTGHVFQTAAGQYFYVFDYDYDAGSGEGYLWVHPWTGVPWTTGQVNNIYALADNDVLTNAASGETCQVDFTARAIEDVGEPIVFDTSVAAASTGFDFYCPPGFVPIGTAGHTVAVNFAAALDGGAATDLYRLNIGVHAATEDMYRYLSESAFAVSSTPQMEHLNARASLGEISQPGTNSDKKVRVTAHNADLWDEPQVAVYNASGAPVAWTNEDGWTYNAVAPAATEKVAPFDAYRSASVSIQRNIIEQQTGNELTNAGRLLSDPGFSTPGASPDIDAANDFFVSTAGVTAQISAASPLITSGGGWAGLNTTYFLYYVAATGAVAATDTPANILFSDLGDPAGASPYPVGGDVLLGWFTTAGGNVLDVQPARVFGKFDHALALTVGSGESANFSTIESAVGFVQNLLTFVTAGGTGDSDYNFEATIRLTSSVVVTAATTITQLDSLVIDGDGHTLTWAPTGVTDIFIVDGDVTSLTLKNVVIAHDDTASAGHAAILMSPLTAHSTTAQLILENITFAAVSGYPAHLLQITSGGNNQNLGRLEVTNVSWESTEHGINIDGVTAGVVGLGSWDINDFRFRARANAATQAAINIRLDDAIATTYSKAFRKVRNCHLHCESTVAGDAFGYGVYLTGAHADHAQVLSTHIYDVAVTAVYGDVEYLVVGDGCEINNTACTIVGPIGPAIYSNQPYPRIKDVAITDYDGTAFCILTPQADYGIVGPGIHNVAATKTPSGNGFQIGGEKCVVKESTFSSLIANGGSAIAFTADGGKCLNNTIQDWDFAVGMLISFVGASNADPMLISGNTIEGSTCSAALFCTADSTNVTITNNSVQVAAGFCFSTFALVAPATHRYWTMTGNTFETADAGCVSLGTNIAWSSFTGNVFISSAVAAGGVDLVDATTALGDTIQALTFTGNTFCGPQNAAAPHHLSITGAGAEVSCTVVGNTTYDTTGGAGGGILAPGTVASNTVY